MTAVTWLLVFVVGVLAVFVVGLLRSHAEIVRALHDAGINIDPDRVHDHSPSARPVTHLESDTAPSFRTVEGVPEPAGASGRRAHDLAGLTPTGGTRTIAVTGTEGATLLAFLTTGCATCAGFWRDFADGVQLPADTRLVVVTKGPEQESPADVAALAAPHVVTVQSTEAWDQYQIPVAPYFVLVDGRRGVVVGEGAANTWDRVGTLLQSALADAGYEQGQVRRRDLLLGRARTERIDRDLLDAGLTPGDPRLYHPPATEKGDDR